ncbi:MAG: MFS transporter [Chloroflexi bacterium]|nr:MFS transporter [Chloroflexota bacterium]
MSQVTPGRIGTFTSLRLRDFRLLLIGTTLSNAAQWVQQVTLGWLVYDLTGSGTMLGTMNLLRSVPTLGLAPAAGVAIDHVARRTLMLATKAWLFVISLALGLALVAGQRELWHLFVFTFLGGVAQAVDMPLRQTVTFDLVPRSLAPNAVALVQTGWGLMRSVGPGVGGFLILWFGPGGNFLVQAGAYALIAVTVLRMRFPPQASPGPRRAALQNLGEGIRFVVRERVTRTFVLMGWVLPLFIVPNYTALPPIYAKDVFHGGPEVLGFLLSSVGVGGILGGLVAASLDRLERRGLLQLGALLLLSLSLIGFAFSSSLWAALLLLALSGFFEMIYLTTNQTLLQLSIPDELRGRVTSIVSLNAGLSPLGAMFAGVGSDLWGPQAATVVLSSAAAVTTVWVFLASPTVREYRLSQAMADSDVRPRG